MNRQEHVQETKEGLKKLCRRLKTSGNKQTNKPQYKKVFYFHDKVVIQLVQQNLPIEVKLKK